MIKPYTKELEHEIIQWEEHCWNLFQKKMKPFCRKYKQKGVELCLEQYWYNYNEPIWKESKTRIEFLPGYIYCCRYSFRKNGMIYKYFGDESACTSYAFVTIKSSCFFWRKLYRSGFCRKRSYVDMEFGEIFDKENVAQDLEEWYEEIQGGDYILAEPVGIYEYS